MKFLRVLHVRSVILLVCGRTIQPDLIRSNITQSFDRIKEQCIRTGHLGHSDTLGTLNEMVAVSSQSKQIVFVVFPGTCIVENIPKWKLQFLSRDVPISTSYFMLRLAFQDISVENHVSRTLLDLGSNSRSWTFFVTITS